MTSVHPGPTWTSAPNPALRPASPRPSVLLPDDCDPTALALIDEDGLEHTHADLRRQVAAAAAHLPDAASRRLVVHLPMTATRVDVVRYLAVIESGHVALVTSADPAKADPIVRRYRPTPWPTSRSGRTPAHQHTLHPDLALLLSTSGSTGSAKLVQLSQANLTANAEAIGHALRLTPADRGITSLPLHYCYGLSVLHAHLRAGAAVVLSGESVLDDAFWRRMRNRVTTMAAVPYTFELLESRPDRLAHCPSLRLITQAGGRMPAEEVRRWAEIGERCGVHLAVMYGQTEATARIAVLDPAESRTHQGQVGRPVLNTDVRVDLSVEGADLLRGVGELVVSGPGVMLGYAERPEHLALGRQIHELRTGDLGCLDDEGRIRIVGRRSGFAKIMGLRIDPSVVEAALLAAGLRACVGADDTHLLVAVAPVPESDNRGLAERARRIVTEAAGLPVAAVRVAVVELSRLDNGKLDRRACAQAVRELAGNASTLPRTAGQGETSADEQWLTAVLTEVLGAGCVDLDASFVELGGDSLSYVQASVRLSDGLGTLPINWQHLPLRSLLQGNSARSSSTGSSADSADGRVDRPGRWARSDRAGRRCVTTSVETSVVLRAIAAVIICGSHAGLFTLLGGAHTLLAVAGFTAARFYLVAPTLGARWRAGVRAMIGVAAPTMVVAAIGVCYGRYGVANVLLSNWLFGTIDYGKRNELWFIDALLASLLLTLVWASLPVVRSRWRMDPWRAAAALAVLALASRYVTLALLEGTIRGMLPSVGWLFAVGVAIGYADTGRRRALTLALAGVGAYGFFPDPARNAVIFAGLALLTVVPTLRLPRLLVPVLGLLASASLYIYLLQFQVLEQIDQPLLATVAALVVGVLAWRLADAPVRRLQHLLLPTRRARSRVEPTAPERPSPVHPTNPVHPINHAHTSTPVPLR